MPDLPTRKFVQHLHKEAEHIFFLNDYDPWGVAISKTYAFPACNAWHQQVRELKNCSLLALSPAQGTKYGLRQGDLLEMTNRDKTRCTNLRNELEVIAKRQAQQTQQMATDTSDDHPNVAQEQGGHPMIRSMIDCVTDMLASGKKYELDAISLFQLERFLLDKLAPAQPGQ